MADSDERKSVESEYESDADGVSPLKWRARRTEASDEDDDGSEEVKRKFRWGTCCEESESESESECYEGLPKCVEGGIVTELEEVSQEENGGEEEEEKVQETVRFRERKEEKVLRPDFVPKSGSFYMHDDRFRSNRRYGRRRVTAIGKKLWDCTDEEKWKHDKFEDTTVEEALNNSFLHFHLKDNCALKTHHQQDSLFQDNCALKTHHQQDSLFQDNIALKTNHQQKRKNRRKGQRYAERNQVGIVENFGNPNNKTSRIVKGRGPVKYKDWIPSSKHQFGKLKESTSSSSSHGVSSWALAMDSLALSNSVTSPQLSRVKQPVSFPNVLLQKKTVGGSMEGYSFPIQQMYQPCSIQNSDNRIPQPQLASPRAY